MSDPEIERAKAQQQRNMDVFAQIEPVAKELQKNWVLTPDLVRISIAISLKRLADVAETALTMKQRNEW